MKKILLLLLFTMNMAAQDLDYKIDSTQIRSIYKYALTDGQAYTWLDALSNNIGARLAGSEGDKKAVAWAKKELDNLGLDSVWLQPVKVPHWIRGASEEAYIEIGFKKVAVAICALGGSIATSDNGLMAEVIEVKSLDELTTLGDKVKGKIVFFNRPLSAEHIETFKAYGDAVDQRYSGARVAGSVGAVGVIVRSMNLKKDNYPHTGSMSYGELEKEKWIPAAAISTQGADALSSLLSTKNRSKVLFYFKQACQNLPEATSYNVIGELKGSEFPEQIIAVGGHLDSWDLGDGSHDDGAGIVQSMELIRYFKRLKPKRTIRVVLFANEENGLAGAKAYAQEVENKKENHIVALESDAGGFSPRGFGFTTNDLNFKELLKWKPLFEPYNIHLFNRGGGGADIGPLKKDHNVLIGLRPDSQRYFDYHHAATDTFDAVNKRELELGAATMCSIIYLFDKYGIR